MKTPREILFEKHRGAGPKLEAIRAGVLAQQAYELCPAPDRRRVSLAERLFQELIWPCRRVWLGLAGVWLVIFTLQFSMRNGAEQRAYLSMGPPSPQVLALLREQKRLIAESGEPDRTGQAEPPRALPRPRSERQRHPAAFALA